MNFTATATSEILSFLALGTPTGDPPIALLDNVSLEDIPEPSSLVFLGAALLGGVTIRRRRARTYSKTLLFLKKKKQKDFAHWRAR